MKYLVALVCVLFMGCGFRQGKEGPQGVPGSQGATGTACTTTPQPGGALVTCGSQSVFISNGTNGTDATPAEVITFCPSLHGGIGFQESGIKVGNQVIAVYYDGTHTFLTPLPAGMTFQTTDGRGCYFVLNADGSQQ